MSLPSSGGVCGQHDRAGEPGARGLRGAAGVHAAGVVSGHVGGERVCSTPGKLTRQCADPITHFETHGTKAQVAYQYLASMSECYRRTIAGCAPFVETHVKTELVMLIDMLRLQPKRKALLKTARDLYARAHRVHRGAAIAEHIAFVYGRLAECVALHLKQEGQIPLYISHMDVLAMVRHDMEYPNLEVLGEYAVEYDKAALKAHVDLCEEVYKLKTML